MSPRAEYKYKRKTDITETVSFLFCIQHNYDGCHIFCTHCIVMSLTANISKPSVIYDVTSLMSNIVDDIYPSWIRPEYIKVLWIEQTSNESEMTTSCLNIFWNSIDNNGKNCAWPVVHEELDSPNGFIFDVFFFSIRTLVAFDCCWIFCCCCLSFEVNRFEMKWFPIAIEINELPFKRN